MPRAAVFRHDAIGGAINDLRDLPAIPLAGVEVPKPADMIAEIREMSDDRVRSAIHQHGVIREITLRDGARIVLSGQSNLRQVSASVRRDGPCPQVRASAPKRGTPSSDDSMHWARNDTIWRSLSAAGAFALTHPQVRPAISSAAASAATLMTCPLEGFP